MNSQNQKTNESAMQETAGKIRLSYKVNDVPQAFKNLPEDGKKETFKNLPEKARKETEHIQGYTQYEENGTYQYLFTMNANGHGYLLKTAKDGQSVQIEIHKDWSHPGGIQAIGTKLLIPCEKDDKSKIFVYDIEKAKMVCDSEDNAAGIKYRDSNGQIKDTFPHKAGSVGITDFKLNGDDYYLLIVLAIWTDGTATKSVCNGYIAKIMSEDIMEHTFVKIGDFFLKDKDGNVNIALDCQGIGLVTDTNNKVYLVALHSVSYLFSYKDLAFLFEITATEQSLGAEQVDKRHFTSKGDSGAYGTHFRWGTGIHITPKGKLVLHATSRNIDNKKLNTNYWK